MSKECLNETNMAFQVYPVYPCFCVLLSFYLEPLLPRPPLPLILCTLVFLLMLTLTLLFPSLLLVLNVELIWWWFSSA